MTVTAEELAAFADGQLDPARAGEVAASIAADPELARQVEAHRALRSALSAHFAPIVEQPVPDRLTALLRDAGPAEPVLADLIDLAGAREARVARRIPRWGWMVGPALAATLVLGLIQLRGTVDGADYADAALASALDTRLSADPVQADQPEILLSFASKSGELCRAYAGQAGSGIACRDARGWRIERRGPAVDPGAGDYRQAGSPLEELMGAAQDMAPNGAFDARQEAAARDRDWR